jgi:biotin carboxyl carrier protein
MNVPVISPRALLGRYARRKGKSPLEAVAATATAAAAAFSATAAATEATSATAAAAAEAAAAAAATEATTAAAAGTLLRLVNADGATVELHAVELGDGFGGAFGVRHRDEGETTRTARFPIRG